MLTAQRANNEYKKHKNQNEEPLQKKWSRLTRLSELFAGLGAPTLILPEVWWVLEAPEFRYFVAICLNCTAQRQTNWLGSYNAVKVIAPNKNCTS